MAGPGVGLEILQLKKNLDIPFPIMLCDGHT